MKRQTNLTNSLHFWTMKNLRLLLDESSLMSGQPPPGWPYSWVFIITTMLAALVCHGLRF